MTRTRAAVYRGQPQFSLEEVELRDLQPGEVRLKMRAAGICGSDRHVLEGDWSVPTPLVGGHEGAGIVEAVADDVTNVKPGDHVVISWYYPCTNCAACKAGKPWICSGSLSNQCLLPSQDAPASSGDEPVFSYLAAGTLSERAIVTSSALVPVPETVPWEVAALIGCSITTGYGAVINDAGVRPGQSVLVIGSGGVGLSVIMAAHLAGATTIIAADVNDHSLELARSFGATHTVDARGDLVTHVRGIVPEGVDFAFEAIGRPQSIELMPPALRLGGSAVVVGLPARDSPVRFDALDLAERGQRIIGSNYGATVPARDFAALSDLYLNGKMPIDRLITKTVPLTQVNDAFDDMRAGARGRTVVVFDE